MWKLLNTFEAEAGKNPVGSGLIPDLSEESDGSEFVNESEEEEEEASEEASEEEDQVQPDGGGVISSLLTPALNRVAQYFSPSRSRPNSQFTEARTIFKPNNVEEASYIERLTHNALTTNENGASSGILREIIDPDKRMRIFPVGNEEIDQKLNKVRLVLNNMKVPQRRREMFERVMGKMMENDSERFDKFVTVAHDTFESVSVDGGDEAMSHIVKSILDDVEHYDKEVLKQTTPAKTRHKSRNHKTPASKRRARQKKADNKFITKEG
jgi:hypothetical protein